MYASIDQVVEKLERRVQRFKGRIYERRKGEGPREKEALKEAITQEAIGAEEAPSEEELPEIVRTKRFPIKPVTPEEAALEMELMHHDFYVFLNADTEQVNVVYKRRDGNYGLIEPEQ
jgi:putative sigma-54 modulation protein